MTDDERRAEHARVIGQPLGDLYHDLENEVAYLIRKWDQFDELFNEDEEQLALLNRVASNFFHFLQIRWYEDALLYISRLTDPAESGRGRQANLTLRRLPLEVNDPRLRAEVSAAVYSAVVKCEFARVWRNKMLAHGDLETAGRRGVSVLPSATRVGVREAALALCEPLRLVCHHFGQYTVFTSLRDLGTSARGGAAQTRI